MDPTAAKYIGAGIACIGMGGAGVGVGLIFGQYLAAALRNPSAAQGQFGNLIFGFAVTEGTDGHRIHEGSGRRPACRVIDSVRRRAIVRHSRRREPFPRAARLDVRHAPSEPHTRPFDLAAVGPDRPGDGRRPRGFGSPARVRTGPRGHHPRPRRRRWVRWRSPRRCGARRRRAVPTWSARTRRHRRTARSVAPRRLLDPGPLHPAEIEVTQIRDQRSREPAARSAVIRERSAAVEEGHCNWPSPRPIMEFSSG